jgi:hypothetical protein
MNFDKQKLLIKLTSRKFWVAVVSFVSLVLFARGMDQGSVEQITSIIMAGGAVIAYIFGEAWVDAYKE